MIRRAFQYLFGWPCDHDWETLIDGDTYSVGFLGKDMGETKIWVYRCRKCCAFKKGNLKTI